MTFKLKNNGLPGDITNATQFWGANSNGAGSVASTATSEVGTFNGDGNSFVVPIGAAPYWAFQEPGAYWQQLANAGYIGGIFNAAMNSVGVANLAQGTNGSPNLSYGNDLASPKSKVSDTAWWGMKYMSASSLLYPASAGVYTGHMLILSSANSCSGGSVTGTEVLTVTEMQNIDAKIDDGQPVSGKVLVPNSNGLQSGWGCFFGQGVSCLTQSATLWTYNSAAGNAKACMPVFRMGF